MFILRCLCIVRVCERLRKHVSISLMFGDVVSDGHNGFAESLCLLISLWVVRCGSEVLDF